VFIILKFAFINDAAEKEYKELPEAIQDEFGKDLRRIQFKQKPTQPITYLSSIGAGVVELKINGSPAYRCVYIAKYHDAVIVLHSFSKTTNGTDQKALNVAKQRFKELKAQL